MTVWLRASPFNIIIIQVYAATSSYDDCEVDEFYRELQYLVSRSNTKAGHSGCTRWLERESWRRCARRLERSLWTFLQFEDQWQRAQALRHRNLQQPCVGKQARHEEKERRTRRSQRLERLKKDQNRDEDGRRDLDTVSMPGSGSMPQKRNNNNKKAYQLVKDLTTEKQGKSTTI